MTYFPKYNGNSASIYDALSAVGANGSYQSRQQIAAANGISNYTGTAAQNTQMLNMLKAGNLINPSGTSTSASSSNNGRTTTTYVISDDGTITETTVPADRTAPVDVTQPMGMNKWLKYGLIAGGVAVAGLLIYKLAKRKKKVEQKPMKKGKLNGVKKKEYELTTIDGTDGIVVPLHEPHDIYKEHSQALAWLKKELKDYTITDFWENDEDDGWRWEAKKKSGNHAKATTISEFSKTRKKTGDKYFRLVDKKGNVGKTVYFINFYERSERKYSISKFEDVNSERFVSPKQLVTTDFEF